MTTNTTVEIGRTRGFVLDDPIAGRLDNTTYPLGGLAYVDVSSRVLGVSINRGKNRDLERFSAGGLGVTFNNQDRFFDPLYGTAIDPIPWTPIRVSMNGTVQFTGVVQDWNYRYEPGGNSYADVQANDEFIQLARQNILSSGSATEQDSGARVSAVLDMFTVDWPADRRNIEVGQSILCSYPFDGSNALDYLQKVELSEFGELFIAKNGDLTFLSRDAAAPRTTSLVKFSDDGTGIPYKRALVNYGSELLTNRAVVEAPAGTAVADNELSQVTYGVLEENYSVLCADQSTLQGLADYVVATYANPEYRFEGLVIGMDNLSTANQDLVMGLELGGVVQIVFTPNNVGDPIEKYAQIIKIQHTIEADSHDVVLGLASLDFASLVLDDSEFGKLDEYALGF